jgi:hypothetical protein
VRVVQNPKFVSDTVNYTFDFTSRLAVGETISSATVTSVVYTGVDASPSAIISGSAAISGGLVTQLITAGVAGVIYELRCAAVTSLGQTANLSAYLAVIPDLQ